MVIQIPGLIIGAILTAVLSTLVKEQIEDMTESIAPAREVGVRFWLTTFVNGRIDEATFRDRLLDAGIKEAEIEAVTRVAKRLAAEKTADLAAELSSKSARVIEKANDELSDILFKDAESKISDLEREIEQLERETNKLREEEQRVSIEDDIEASKLTINLLEKQIPIPRAEKIKLPPTVDPITFTEVKKAVSDISKIVAAQAVEAGLLPTVDQVLESSISVITTEKILTKEQLVFAAEKKYFDRTRVFISDIINDILEKQTEEEEIG